MRPTGSEVGTVQRTRIKVEQERPTDDKLVWGRPRTAELSLPGMGATRKGPGADGRAAEQREEFAPSHYPTRAKDRHLRL